ncbi:MFS transporter [Paenibacillus sp. A14]|uniref:MFS transporter n=1 Tax=Paenibacillus sp. A14 TaxID=3119820 RepID=UPI002FDFBB8F
MKRLLWMGCLAYLLIGLAHVVVGSIMPNLLEHYGSFVNFLPSLMIEKTGTDKATAALSVTVFWIAMTAGRLFAGVIAEKISYSRYVIMCCLGSFLMISVFALVHGLTVLMVFIVLLGLFMSGLFSIALVFANKLLPGAEEMTPSLLIASGGVGGAFLPLWMGKSMDWGGAGASSWSLSAFVAALVLFSIAAMVVKRMRTVTGSEG